MVEGLNPAHRHLRHTGPWDLSDTDDEGLFLFQSFATQKELRNIKTRNRDEVVKARDDGRRQASRAMAFATCSAG